MESKIMIPESVCHDEVVDYLAALYSLTPRQVVNQFLCQDGVMGDRPTGGSSAVAFEENEMAILRDMGIRPSRIEFIGTNN